MHVSSDHYPSNHHNGMVEMDKIVSQKRGWVDLMKPNLQDRRSHF
jgi:hypothetical protein